MNSLKPRSIPRQALLNLLARGSMVGEDYSLSLTGQGVGYDFCVVGSVESKTHGIAVDDIHLTGDVVVFIERNARKLSYNGFPVHEEVVSDSQQLVPLVTIVPIAALDNQTLFIRQF